MKIFLLLLLIITSTAAQDKLFDSKVDIDNPQKGFQKISKALSETKALTADFSQLKKIKVLKRPLKSSGKLTLANTLGVHWKLQKPYESTIIINSEKMTAIDDKGKKVTFTADEKPIIYNFTRIFMSIFTGNTDELQEHFDLYFDGSKEEWRIGLIPKSSQLRKVISKITLKGKGEQLRFLNIIEGNSDTTDITFSNMKRPQQLSEKDKKKFDF